MQEGVINLVSGRSFTQDEINDTAGVVIISQELAERNGLTVGSTVMLESRIYDHRLVGLDEVRGIDWKTPETLYANLEFELEVIGIFKVLNGTNTGFEQIDEWHMKELLNQMYMSADLAETARAFYFDHTDELFTDLWGDVGDRPLVFCAFCIVSSRNDSFY